MNNKKLYQDTFSQVCSATELSWEDMEQKKGGRRRPKTTLLAAVLVLLAGFSTVGYASGWFGLRELVVQKKTELTAPAPQQGQEDAPLQERPAQTADLISLSGYVSSPESLALAQWQAFLDSYDRDGAILDKIGNSPTGVTAPYANFYTVYTQEMAEKLEHIANQYGLALHTVMDIVTGKELEERVGGSFLMEGHDKNAAYIYENGTFQTDGAAVLEGHGAVSYQLRREVKGTLGDVLLNITDVDTYEDWQYETQRGEWVMLALGPAKALIFADYPDCFITVNVLAGTDAPAGDVFSDGALNRAELESLADGIDFSVLKIVTNQK